MRRCKCTSCVRDGLVEPIPQRTAWGHENVNGLAEVNGDQDNPSDSDSDPGSNNPGSISDSDSQPQAFDLVDVFRQYSKEMLELVSNKVEDIGHFWSFNMLPVERLHVKIKAMAP
jgi:hypothetical protein